MIAAVALLLADEFVRNFARGNSEGLLVAFCLLALERHLDGRRRRRVPARLRSPALLRPEVWPFCGPVRALARRRVARAAAVADVALVGGLAR